jgi:hypothetical protein
MSPTIQRLMAAMPENVSMTRAPGILTYCGLKKPKFLCEDLENTVFADEMDVVMGWANMA